MPRNRFGIYEHLLFVSFRQAELTGQEEQAMSLDPFLATVKKYTEVKEMTPTVLR